MATRISNLSSVSSLNDADEMVVVQSGTTYKTSVSTVADKARSTLRWSNIDSSFYTASTAMTTTSRILLTDTSDFAAGLPVKYEYGGTEYYGVVSAVSAGTHIDIRGAALSPGSDLTNLYVGLPEMAVQWDMFVSGTYGDGANDLLANDMYTKIRWKGSVMYLVAFDALHNTADGGTQPSVNVKVNGSGVSSDNSNNGVQLSTSGTWVANSAVAINTSNYDLQYNEEIEIACTVAGGSGNATDLTVSCLFVVGS